MIKEAIGNGDDRYYHLVLLAENQEGYQNLMKIVSIGFTEGYYYKPRVDMDVLKKYSKGIIALSACLAGEVQRNIARGMYSEGKAAAPAIRRYSVREFLPGITGSWIAGTEAGQSVSSSDVSGDRD